MNILRQEQARFDARYFDPPQGYEVLATSSAKIVHIGQHLGKIVGIKTIHWARQEWETPARKAIILREVIPDLSIYRTQLANTINCDDETLAEGADRLKPTLGQVPRQLLHTHLVEARGMLDAFGEPLAHMRPTNMTRVRDAAVILHFAVDTLGDIYGVQEQLEAMHLARFADQQEHLR